MNDFTIGEWQVSPSRNRIFHRLGEEVQLEPKPMQVLVRLALANGAVVTREEILETVWPGEFVTEHVLSRCISALRKALRDDQTAPRYIETIRKRGYRLAAPIETAATPPATARDATAGRRRRSIATLTFIAAILVAFSISGWGFHRTRKDEPQTRFRVIPLTSLRGSELDPALSPDGARLAFSWSGPSDENFDIYVKTIDAEDAVRVTSHPGEDKNPAWSPRGDLIAFVRSAPGGSGIYVASVPGGAERKLVDTVSGDIPDLVWSRDGKSLYFPDRAAADEPSAVFRLDLATLRKHRITDPGPEIDGDRDLAISPDGKWLAFARAKTPSVEDLWVVMADGREPRMVSSRNRPINGIEWSFSSRTILFSSPHEGVMRLWSIGSDGKNLHALTELGDDIFDPSLSRDGRSMAFERKSYDTNLWRLDLSSISPPVLLLGSTRWDSTPAISPDGTRIAFVSDRTSLTGIWICNRDGTGLLRLMQSHLPLSTGPRWSPDGRSIVFAARQDGYSRIFRVDANGGKVAQLTGEQADDTDPLFSSDGRSIVFSSDRSGRREILRIDPGRPDSKPVQLSHEGGFHPRESSDGRTIFFEKADRAGLWSMPAAGGGGTLVFASPGSLQLTEWEVAPSGIYFVHTSDDQAGTGQIVRFDFETERFTPVSPPLRGLYAPELGLSIAPDESYLLFGRVDDDDGDIALVEGFAVPGAD